MALGSVGLTVPFAACGHWRAGPSATIIIVMNESLRQHLECLARDECYRVDAVLKEGRLRAHGVPQSVRDVVAQATAFDPADRFGSVGAMRAAFMYAVGCPVDFRKGSLAADTGCARGAGDIWRGDSASEAGCAQDPGFQPGLRMDGALRPGSVGHAADSDLAGVTPGAAEPALSSAVPGASTLRDAKKRGRSEAFAHGAKVAFRWLWEFWSGIAHRLPLGVGVAWDILLAAWGAVMAFACVASGMNPQGDMARLPAVACAVSYVCVWLVMDCPIPLLVDTRPIEKLFPLFERPSLKQRVVAAAGMAGVAFAVLTLIGILFLRES